MRPYVHFSSTFLLSKWNLFIRHMRLKIGYEMLFTVMELFFFFFLLCVNFYSCMSITFPSQPQIHPRITVHIKTSHPCNKFYFSYSVKRKKCLLVLFLLEMGWKISSCCYSPHHHQHHPLFIHLCNSFGWWVLTVWNYQLLTVKRIFCNGKMHFCFNLNYCSIFSI